MRSKIKYLIDSSLPDIASHFNKSLPSELTYDLELPRTKSYGDLATNLAFKLSKPFHHTPFQIAKVIKEILEKKYPQNPELQESIQKIVVEKPGFVNFFFTPQILTKVLLKIKREDKSYGSSDYGQGEKLLLEYVSANPTGPLTIAHGRQACLGDALANILKATGYEVFREFYLNDTGRQIDLLGTSVLARYKELFNKKVKFPKDGYQGSYISDLAKKIRQKEGDSLLAWSEGKAIKYLSEWAAKIILSEIKEELDMLGVQFDNYFSEKSLHLNKKLEKVLKELKSKNLLYEQDNALWFKSTKFADDKDRVLKKSSGEYTYVVPDMAYHESKFERGYERVINFWGPDHHGYVPRLKAACEALGYSQDKIIILIVQLSTLYRQGEPVRMSTRSGEFVTLRELREEVGEDATRFFFLMRKLDSHLDFDLELAKEKSQDNPVYYVQYAHARICSILEFSKTKVEEDVDLSLLGREEELELIKLLSEYPNILIQAAKYFEPYRIIDYLMELATSFHKFYTLHRVVTQDQELTRARLLLVECTRTVLRNGLQIIGVSQPIKM